MKQKPKNHPPGPVRRHLAVERRARPVQRRTEDLWVDWFGSGARRLQRRARRQHHALCAVAKPGTRPELKVIAAMHATSLAHDGGAGPMGCIAPLPRQDDVHNGSVFHPAAVVFPPAGVAQSDWRQRRELMAARVAGYEVGIRVGEFLGRSHYKIFHTTATAGTLAGGGRRGAACSN